MKFMNNILFSQADEVYKCSQLCNLVYIDIEYPELRLFSKNVKDFFSLIGELKEEEYWIERKRILRKLIFLFSSAPLSKGYLLEKLNETISFLEIDIANCAKFYPLYKLKYQSLLDDLRLILDTQLDLIKFNTDEVVKTLEGSIAILIKDRSLIPVIKENYHKEYIHIIDINSLRSKATYENIIVIGSASKYWFPDFIFSSPRARKILVVKFVWVKEVWQPKPVFLDPIISNRNKHELVNSNELIEKEEYIESEFFLPKFDFSSIISKSWQLVERDSDEEYVEAIIAHLENDQIVFLDYDDSSMIRIIDVEDEEVPVKKIKVKNLTQDMFLLLRASGGGDYIVQLANKILGDRTEELRSSQKKWKDYLRGIVKEKGETWVINELISKGCTIANSTNLRNWMSYRSIKTKSFAHFKCIMEVINLPGQVKDIWQQMSLITQAHIKAGHHVTKLLLELVKKTDLNDLIQQGIMEFELTDKDAGVLIAFRVKALSDPRDTVLVSPTRIGIPCDIE